MSYNGVNLYDTAFLRVMNYYKLMPPLIPYKTAIPWRSGAFNHGSDTYGEVDIRLECLIERSITDAQFDTLKYLLSKKGDRIIFWDHPNRFHTGQSFQHGEVLDYGRKSGKTFELILTCEPFATGVDPVVLHSKTPLVPVYYSGSRKTPTRITIRNTGTTPLQGIVVTAYDKT